MGLLTLNELSGLGGLGLSCEVPGRGMLKEVGCSYRTTSGGDGYRTCPTFEVTPGSGMTKDECLRRAGELKREYNRQLELIPKSPRVTEILAAYARIGRRESALIPVLQEQARAGVSSSPERTELQGLNAERSRLSKEMRRLSQARHAKALALAKEAALPALSPPPAPRPRPMPRPRPTPTPRPRPAPRPITYLPPLPPPRPTAYRRRTFDTSNLIWLMAGAVAVMALRR